jgi:hypothetical protein
VSRSLRSQKVGGALRARVIVQPATRSAGLLARGRERDLPGSQAIHPVPLPRSSTPAEPTIPRLFDGLVDAAPALPTAKASALMNFGAQSRGFSTRCLRFKSDVATTRAKLASGWLARLYREGVEPSGSQQKVSDRSSSFSGFILAQGKFHDVSLSALQIAISLDATDVVQRAWVRWQPWQASRLD